MKNVDCRGFSLILAVPPTKLKAEIGSRSSRSPRKVNETTRRAWHGPTDVYPIFCFRRWISFTLIKPSRGIIVPMEKSIIEPHVGQDDSYSMGHMWVRIVLTQRFKMQVERRGCLEQSLERFLSGILLLFVTVRFSS